MCMNVLQVFLQQVQFHLLCGPKILKAKEIIMKSDCIQICTLQMGVSNFCVRTYLVQHPCLFHIQQQKHDVSPMFLHQPQDKKLKINPNNKINMRIKD